MDGLLETAPVSLDFSSTKSSAPFPKNKAAQESAILQKMLPPKAQGDEHADQVILGGQGKALSITIQKILDKLNELLRAKLPQGLQDLKPEDHTPEATASRIVDGIAGLFGIFAKSNPDLEGEELLSRFMTAARKGVETGYGDAYETLEGIGAFEVAGVKEGVERTRVLIDEKLNAFEDKMRKVLGIEPVDVEAEVAELTSQALLAQGGAATTTSSLSIAA